MKVMEIARTYKPNGINLFENLYYWRDVAGYLCAINFFESPSVASDYAMATRRFEELSVHLSQLIKGTIKPVSPIFESPALQGKN